MMDRQEKTQVLNEALRSIPQGDRSKELLDLRGQVEWSGDIDQLRKRTSRFS